MSRAFAAHGGCYVVAIGSLLRPEDVPEPYRDLVHERSSSNDEGGSCILALGGRVIAAAPADEETILTASVTLEAVLQHKAVIDLGAHYSRPDVLQLQVNRSPIERVVEHPRSGFDEPPAAVPDAEKSPGSSIPGSE